MSTKDESVRRPVNTSKVLDSSEFLNVYNGVLDEIAVDNQDAGRVGAAAIAYADAQVPVRLPMAIERAETQKLDQHAKRQANEQVFRGGN